MVELSKITNGISEKIGVGLAQEPISNSDLMAAVKGSGLNLEDLQALVADGLIEFLHS